MRDQMFYNFPNLKENFDSRTMFVTIQILTIQATELLEENVGFLTLSARAVIN